MPFLPPPGEVADEARRRFGAFVATQVNPGTERRDERCEPIPRRLIEMAGDLGMIGYSMPVDVGGEGRDLFSWGVTLEQLGLMCTDGSFALLVSLYPSIAKTLIELKRPELIERYVKPMVRGRCLGAWSYTERSDAFSFQSRANPVPGGFVLTGEKLLITGGALADILLVYVGDGTGDLQLFLVERGDPGVEVTPEATLGVRASALASLKMNEVFVPEDRLLWKTDGLSHAQAYLNQRRALLVCPILGGMRAVLGACVEHLETMVRYGQPLTAFPNVRATLGRLYLSIESTRTILYRALDRLRWEGTDPRWDPQISLAKYVVANEAIALGQTILRLAGTVGYKRGPYERFVRDALSLIAGAGTQDSLEIGLGSQLIEDVERARGLGVFHRPVTKV